jgi:homoserine kinase
VATAAREAGALGCVLSGAGPSVLAAATADVERIARSMEAALCAEGVTGTARALPVDLDGATWRAGPWPGPSPIAPGSPGPPTRPPRPRG